MQNTESKKLAPAWWEEGKCLITGGTASKYLNIRKSLEKRKQSNNRTNWGMKDD